MGAPGATARGGPPPGFEEVPSAVGGIRVFRPVVGAAGPDPTAFRCPRCGASTRFDVGAEALACPYCAYTEAPAAERVGAGAEAHEFTVEALARAAHGWGVDRRELHCDGCGGSVVVEERSLAASCPFCASAQVRRREREDDGLRPRYLVPFAVAPDALGPAVRAFLCAGWLHPAELGRLARLERFTGVYLPFWTFSARLAADWEAEVGHEESRQEWDPIDKRYERKTVTVWRRERGQARLDERDLFVPGTSRVPIARRLDPWRAEGFVAYDPAFLAGFAAQAWDVGLLEAWDEGKHLLRERARAACLGQCSTSKVRGFSMSCDLDDESWRYVLLPVWLAAYRFGGRTWQIAVNGQTGAVVGQKPVAWWKVWAAISLMLTPGVGLLVLSLPLLLVGVGVFSLVLGVILTIAALPFSKALYDRAVASEAP